MKLNASSPIEFIIDNPDWSCTQQSDQSILLLCPQPESHCWFEVVIDCPEQSEFLQRNTFYLHQNNALQGVDMHTEGGKRKSLIFYRHNPLNSIQLCWTEVQPQASHTMLKCSIKKLGTAAAIFKMLKFVSNKDKSNGDKSSRVYRKSYARWRKAGYKKSLELLVREYKHLLTHQLISCEPYQYWQQVIEAKSKLQILYNQQGLNHNYEFVLLLNIRVHNEMLQETLNSIQQQSYPHWRLFLISEVPSKEHKQWLKLTETEPRIVLMHNHSDFVFKQNQFVMKMASGDQLSSDALAICALRLNEKPAVKVLYTDHDILNEEHQRSEPAFKPRWNPELFLSTNYMAPSVLLNTELMQLDSPQDQFWYKQNSYLWLLNAIGRIAPENRSAYIEHLEHVTYHQSHVNREQSYSKEKRELIQQALANFLLNDKEPVLNVGKGKTKRSFRVRYKIPRPLPLVSIVIPTRDMLDVLQQCVKSILDKTTYPNFEILVVDNDSREEQTLHWFDTVASDPRIRVINYPHPFNFSAINNFAVSQAKGTVIALVNNDTEVISPDWLTDMVQHVFRQGAGAIGAKLYYFDDTIQHAGVVLGLWGLAGHSHKNYKRTSDGYLQRLKCTQNYSAVTAACLVVSKEKYLEVGGLNEKDLTVSFNDVDFCLKLVKQGYRNIWTPYAELYHYESKSRGPEDSPEKKVRERGEINYMHTAWTEKIQQDPNYSPHLTKVREDFSVGIESTSPPLLNGNQK